MIQRAHLEGVIEQADAGTEIVERVIGVSGCP